MTTSASRSTRENCSRASRACCAAYRRGRRQNRGSPEVSSGARQQFGRCEIDLEARRLFDGAADGAEVPLTAMEYDLIRVFLANPNRVLSRDQLLMRTRNREWEPFDRSIDIRIGRLRRKVEPDSSGEPRVIRTVRNAGYMYVPLAA